MAKQQINQSQAQGTTLGYAQITSSFSTSSTTAVQVTGLSSTVTIPSGGRKVRITAYAQYLQNTAGSFNEFITIWDGTVGSGTQVGSSGATNSATNSIVNGLATAVVTPPAGSKTYNVGLNVSGGTGVYAASSSGPGYILVELI